MTAVSFSGQFDTAGDHIVPPWRWPAAFLLHGRDAARPGGILYLRATRPDAGDQQTLT